MSPDAIQELLLKHLGRTVELWLEVRAHHYGFSDAGPHNLAKVDVGSAWKVFFLRLGAQRDRFALYPQDHESIV